MAFFPQYKYDDILQMPQKLFDTLKQVADRKSAIDKLNAMDATSYPYMDEKNRGKLHKSIFRIAFPEKFIERAVTTEDLMEKYGR